MIIKDLVVKSRQVLCGFPRNSDKLNALLLLGLSVVFSLTTAFFDDHQNFWQHEIHVAKKLVFVSLIDLGQKLDDLNRL